MMGPFGLVVDSGRGGPTPYDGSRFGSIEAERMEVEGKGKGEQE